MDAGMCPNCGTGLEEDARFCHGCGLDLSHPSPPSFKGGPPASFPVPMHVPGMAMPEPPPSPMAHPRALSVIGGIVLLFASAMLVILALVYLLDYGWMYRAHWDQWDYYEERVMVLEWIVAGIFELVAFSIGLSAGILTLRGTRFHVAAAGAVLVVIASLIGFRGDIFGEVPFIPILAIIAAILVFFSRDSFRTPERKGRRKVSPAMPDNYGWERAAT